MTCLITGASGQLGRELASQLADECVLMDSQQLNVTKADQVRATVGRLRPTTVINCAAYTQVDLAEQQPELCKLTNAIAPGYLAEACNQVDAALVHLSTDYVFGAERTARVPYVETDLPTPRGVYARSKLDGEVIAAQAHRHFIVRSCGLYGDSPKANNFVEAMFRQARASKPLRVVDDQICSPTSVKHLAKAIRKLLTTQSYGTYHLVNSGAVSWFEFARALFEFYPINVLLEPISTSEYGAIAPRPAYSALDNSKYTTITGESLPTWRDALHEFLSHKNLLANSHRQAPHFSNL